MNTKFGILGLAAAIAVSGCTSVDPATGQRISNKTATGAIIGAAAGAAVGAVTNTNKDEQTRKNAIIGAGIGALAGAAIGNYMDRQEAKLRKQTQGSGIGVVRNGNEIQLVMPSDITFDFDRADIKPSFQGTLSEVAKTLAEFPQTTVDVVGHADSVGSNVYNQALSERRSDSVARFLIGQGVQGERIIAIGRGEDQPIADNTTPDGRAKNRRVEIRLKPITA